MTMNPRRVCAGPRGGRVILPTPCSDCVAYRTCRPGAVSEPWGCSSWVDEDGHRPDDKADAERVLGVGGPEALPKAGSQDAYCQGCLLRDGCNVMLTDAEIAETGCQDRIEPEPASDMVTGETMEAEIVAGLPDHDLGEASMFRQDDPGPLFVGGR